jgi:transcriptional regulator with XRE-family HTH domain
MSQEDIFINGELLRLRREARGWVLNDLATRACMSVKQIRQLEEGGMSSFYSAAVKMTSAKKVGALLGLSAEEVFAQEVEVIAEQQVVESEVLVAKTEVAAIENKQTVTTPAPREAAQIEAHTATTHEPVGAQTIVEESKSNTSLWIIAGLFAAALAVAAYMQPKDEPAVEAAPPLQVLPADVADPASAASAADMPASSAEASALPASAPASVGVAVVNVQKPASSAAPVSSAPRVVAPVPISAAPVTVRPASATAATPAVSAASKAP